MADKILGFLGDLVEPASGGGGGNYVYYSRANDFDESLLLASILKVKADSAITFMPIGIAMGPGSFNPEDIMGVGFDLSMKVTDHKSGELVTVGDVIAECSKEWTQITEEEFYKIPTQFTFILNGEPKRYDYKEGMTWGEWIDSPYNDGNFSVHDANMGEGIQEYVLYEYSAITDNEYYYVKPTDLIQPNRNYVLNNQVG